MEQTGLALKWAIVETLSFCDTENNQKNSKKNPDFKGGVIAPLFVCKILAKGKGKDMAKKKTVKDEDILSLIKTEYVSDPKMSYRKLADKYKFPLKKIAAAGKKENWKQLRVQLGDKIFKKTMNRISTQKADEFSRVINSAGRMLGVIEKAMDDEKQFNRYVLSDGIVSTEQIYDKVDTRAVKDMTTSLKELANLVAFVKNEQNNAADTDNDVKVVFEQEEENKND